MIVDLVQVTTDDGVRLDGALRAPSDGVARELGVDAFLYVHGTGSNFYGSTLLADVAERLLATGAALLSVNTRGHDLACTVVGREGGRRQGAAYECVADCVHDLTAWTDLLAERGYGRICLVGHSLGAVKCVYAMARRPHANVARVVAASPPRLTYTALSTGASAEVFLQTLAEAEAHVGAGRPGTLMDVSVPLPYVVTAEGFVDKYGRDETYDVVRHAGGLTCPALFTFGGIEVQTGAAFRGVPEALASCATTQELTVATIAGGDHIYSGVRNEWISRVLRWLRRAGA